MMGHANAIRLFLYLDDVSGTSTIREAMVNRVFPLNHRPGFNCLTWALRVMDPDKKQDTRMAFSSDKQTLYIDDNLRWKEVDVGARERAARQRLVDELTTQMEQCKFFQDDIREWIV